MEMVGYHSSFAGTGATSRSLACAAWSSPGNSTCNPTTNAYGRSEGGETHLVRLPPRTVCLDYRRGGDPESERNAAHQDPRQLRYRGRRFGSQVQEASRLASGAGQDAVLDYYHREGGVSRQSR